jgi:crotonobetainyl-CoA:carnitine CoA-transferase CaiB-like acyl-CoA transferase
MAKQDPGLLGLDTRACAKARRVSDSSNGFPDEKTGQFSGPPVRPSISLGDSVAGLTAAFGTVLALLARRGKQDKGLTEGLTVDVSIMER